MSESSRVNCTVNKSAFKKKKEEATLISCKVFRFTNSLLFISVSDMATTKAILSFPWIKSKDGELKKEKVKISESLLKVAKQELREDKATREQALEQMRDWLRKNKDVENVRTDDTFLLRFLRNKKFSVPMAQQQLLKYLNLKRVMSHYTSNLDFMDKGVQNLFNNGYIVASPIRDRQGRRVILYFASELITFLKSLDYHNDLRKSHQSILYFCL